MGRGREAALLNTCGMSKTLYLVASVPTQQTVPSRADELYTSHWFTTAKAYVSHFAREDDSWVILSAKYGVLDPSREVKPYEERQISRNRIKRQAWTKSIIAELLKRTEPGDTIVALAGQRQRENLIAPLTAAQRQVEIPMADLRISQQKAWMRKKLEEAGVAQPEDEVEAEVEVDPSERPSGLSSSALMSEASRVGGGSPKSDRSPRS